MCANQLRIIGFGSVSPYIQHTIETQEMVGVQISFDTFHKYSATFKLGKGAPNSLISCITLASFHRPAMSSSVRGNGGGDPSMVQCSIWGEYEGE